MLGGMILMLSVSAITAYMTSSHIDYELQTQKIQVQSLAHDIAGSVSASLLTGRYSQVEEMLVLHSSFPGVLKLLITNEHGKPLIMVVSSTGSDPKIIYSGETIPLPASVKAVTDISKDTLRVWQPIEGGTLIGWLKIDYSLEQLRANQAQTLVKGLGVGVIAIAFGIALLLMFLAHPMRAIDHATEFARRLNQNQGETFTPDRSARELEQLGEALNEASHQLHKQAQDLIAVNAALRNNEEKFRAVSDTANGAIVMADSQGKIVYLNKFAENTFGYATDEAIGKPLTILMPEKFQSAHQAGLQTYLASGKTNNIGKTVELLGKRKDGTEFPLELSLASWRSTAGLFFTGVMRDISQRKKAEAAARHLADIVESSNDAIISKNLNDEVSSWNTAAQRLYGYRAEEIIGQSIMLLVPPDKIDEDHDFLARSRRGEHIVRYETVRLKKSGEAVDVAITISPLQDADGNIVGSSIIACDITERKRAEARILELSLTDELTGLYNRRGFFTLAKARISLAQRMQLGLQLFYIDLDGMKKINDQLGHLEGDRALQDTANILRETFRSPDLITRLGGDEFVVLAMHNPGNPQEQIIARLQANTAQFNATTKRLYTLAMSVGGVSFDPDAQQTLEAAVAASDAAMYHAKIQRRNKS